MENKKISSQYPSRSYGNRQQPEKKVKKAEGQNIFALVSYTHLTLPTKRIV